MKNGYGRFLTLITFNSLVSVVLIVVIVVFLLGLIMVLARRDARRREKNASSGIMKAAAMNTQQAFQLNTEELDLDALCSQPKIRALMDEDERKILREYADGETESELAAKHLMPRNEMESLVSELFARLEVNNRAELLKKLQQMLHEEE